MEFTKRTFLELLKEKDNLKEISKSKNLLSDIKALAKINDIIDFDFKNKEIKIFNKISYKYSILI